MVKADRGDKCLICGSFGALEVHHMLHGSRRAKADKYGLTCHLCRACHMALHDRGLHDLELERMAQQDFEERYGHEKWMQEFGKNYI